MTSWQPLLLMLVYFVITKVSHFFGILTASEICQDGDKYIDISNGIIGVERDDHQERYLNYCLNSTKVHKLSLDKPSPSVSIYTEP